MARNGTKKATFLAAMMTCRHVKDAALQSGVGLRTAWRWLRDEVFQAELRHAQDEALGQATRLTVGSMADAIECLQAVMADQFAPPSARVAAARAVLEYALRSTELLALERRVGELEKVVPLVITVARWEGSDAK